MQGYILIDKPLNWTSFDVVKKVKGITKTKVGHAGTLDPLATGLLILLLGPYTKKADQFLKLDKTYLATIELGSISATDDAEGEIKHKTDKQIPQEEVEKAIKSFIGKQKQVPPQFSAVKVGGQKAYNRARAGKTTKLDPRDIQIYSIEDINYSWPTLSFVTEVSSGTYIRSLARDIGQKLGCGGYLKSLVRTSIGKYHLNDAISMENLNIDVIQNSLHNSGKPASIQAK